MALCDGHKASIYGCTQLLISIWEMDTDNDSVLHADSGCHLGVRGVMSKYFEAVRAKGLKMKMKGRRWGGKRAHILYRSDLLAQIRHLTSLSF